MTREWGEAIMDWLDHATGVAPEERQRLRSAIRQAEQASFDAKLEDMGYDECPTCLANRRRDAWCP